jgi:YggT family protein
MQTILSIIYFLLSIAIDFYIFILLLRLLFQKLGASWHNPISQFVIRFTEPVIRPLRRFIPGFHGFDLSIVFVVFVIEMLEAWLLGILHFRMFFGFWSVLIIAFGNMALSFSNIYFYAVIVSALMSWAPLLQNHPLGQVAILISRPFLNIFRRFIPPMGGFDLSPLFALISLILINRLVLSPIVALGINLAFKH